jgi:hypothetical protein
VKCCSFLEWITVRPGLWQYSSQPVTWLQHKTTVFQNFCTWQCANKMNHSQSWFIILVLLSYRHFWNVEVPSLVFWSSHWWDRKFCHGKNNGIFILLVVSKCERWKRKFRLSVSLYTKHEYATFEGFTGVKIQVEVFWVATLCSVGVGYDNFRGPYCLHTLPQRYVASQPRRSWLRLTEYL